MIIDLFLEIGLWYENFVRISEFAVELPASAVPVNHLPQNDAVVVRYGHHVAIVMRHLHLPYITTTTTSSTTTIVYIESTLRG